MAEIVLEARHIRKVFPRYDAAGGVFVALDDVSLAVAAGECLVVSGANGSGKTLLMKILAALAEPDAGDVFFKGAPVAGKNAVRAAVRGVRRRVGLVFQDADAQILGETPREDVAVGPRNLKMPPLEAKNAADAALAATGLAEKADFPARQLSGGEKRRLAIAGVLALGAEIVIMDEPFANLDLGGVRDTLSVIKKMKDEGRTLIILTHELEKVLAFADRLVILSGGAIVLDGAPDAVLDRLHPEYGVRDPRTSYTRAADCTWL